MQVPSYVEDGAVKYSKNKMVEIWCGHLSKSTSTQPSSGKMEREREEGNYGEK